MNKICFILPFYSQKLLPQQRSWPPYFDYFIESFSKNISIDLKIFTNISYRRYQSYQGGNINFYSMPLWKQVKLIGDRLNLRINPLTFRPYKLCDFKPTFGIIYSDYLKGYDFWGYCDPDMIIGNLSNFFKPKNMEGFELITAGHKHGSLPGYMTVYRNCKKMNFAFEKSPDYLKVFKSRKNYEFDEDGVRGIIAMEQVVEHEGIKINNLVGLVHNDGGGLNSKRAWKYRWENGSLVDCLTQKEIGSLHLVKSKKNINFVMEPLEKDVPFDIAPGGIFMLRNAGT